MVGIGKDAYEFRFGGAAFCKESYKALRHDEWSGSFLGGFHVEFRNLEQLEKGGSLVEITIINDMGWKSGTRIPFTRISYRENEDRSAVGPGGTLWQFYIWKEVIYLDK